MADFDLRDAFEHVTDRLVGEGHLRVADVEKRLEAEQRHNDAVRERDKIKSELETAKARLKDWAGADDAMVELYKAIDQAAVKLNNVGDKAGSDFLRDKMVAAKKFIDPIPF